MKPVLDRRPIIVALAGPNGAGKTTFYHAHLKPSGLRLLDPDLIARELQLSPQAAGKAVAAARAGLLAQRVSFVMETVFSDPVGDKIRILKQAAATGYTVVLWFIGVAGPETSEVRVAMRVSQGGHDVPTEKLVARYPRTMANLRTAARDLPYVSIFDSDDLRQPYRLVATLEHGQPTYLARPLPRWLKTCLPNH